MIWVLGSLVVAALGAVLAATLILLRKIDVQFSADGGLSLRDATNRLESVAQAQSDQLDRLILLVAAAAATGLRIEEGAGVDRSAVLGVAANLLEAQQAVDALATDRADAYDRAEAVPTDGPPGRAGDAANRRPGDGA